MITEGQYLDALTLVRRYLSQIESEVTEVRDEFLDSLVIGSIDISQRARGVIMNYFIREKGEFVKVGYELTFRQLKSNGKRHLSRQRNCGPKTVDEFSDLFEKNGHKFL